MHSTRSLVRRGLQATEEENAEADRGVRAPYRHGSAGKVPPPLGPAGGVDPADLGRTDPGKIWLQ